MVAILSNNFFEFQFEKMRTNIMKSKGYDLLFNLLIEKNGKACIIDNILNFHFKKNRMKFRQKFTKIVKDFYQCYDLSPSHMRFKGVNFSHNL